MRVIFLLLVGVLVISFKGFAELLKEETVDASVEAQWISILNNKANWRERREAIENWRMMAQSNPEKAVFYLQSMLSYRSQKVRRAAVTALEEMAEEFLYFNFRLKIVRALAEQVPSETDSLFLDKMKAVKKIFRYTGLYMVLEHSGEATTLFEKSGVSGVDQVLIALHKMAETGVSNKKNMEIRWTAIQLLDTILDTLVYHIRGRYAPPIQPIVASQFSDHILKGAQIAVKGLSDKNPKIQSATEELLRKTFQEQKFSDSQISRIIPLVATEGLSHSNYEVRKSTVDLLLEIAGVYPSLSSGIAVLIKERQKQERSHHMKIFMKNAVTQLTRQNNKGQALLKQSSQCEESLNE